jgi:hypothetical protein
MFVQHGCTNLGLSPNRPYQKAFVCRLPSPERQNRGLDHVLGEQLRMYSSLVFTVLRSYSSSALRKIPCQQGKMQGFLYSWAQEILHLPSYGSDSAGFMGVATLKRTGNFQGDIRESDFPDTGRNGNCFRTYPSVLLVLAPRPPRSCWSVPDKASPRRDGPPDLPC